MTDEDLNDIREWSKSERFSNLWLRQHGHNTNSELAVEHVDRLLAEIDRLRARRLDDASIEAIRQREAKAAPGPWCAGSGDSRSNTVNGPGNLFINVRIAGEFFSHWKDTAEFIAHARQDIPTLLDYIDFLRGLIADQRSESGMYEQGYGDGFEQAAKSMKAVCLLALESLMKKFPNSVYTESFCMGWEDCIKKAIEAVWNIEVSRQPARSGNMALSNLDSQSSSDSTGLTSNGS